MAVTYAGLSADQKASVNAIVGQAKALGVNVRTALATAWQESRFNSQAKGDVQNGRPTSFGLFQLHEGGELGNLTPQQAFDPNTNARTALTVVAGNTGKYSDPGTLAAKSQRPKNPQAYAQAINATYADPTFLPDINDAQPSAGGTTTIAPSTSDAGFSPTDALSSLTKASTWIRALEVIAGGALVALGLILAARNGGD